MATLRHAAIERLGSPAAPSSTRRFFVGDVYIRLDDPSTEIAEKVVRYPSNVYKGRGSKIGQIDVRQSIETGAPKFRFTEAKLVEGVTVEGVTSVAVHGQ
ncbi:MULTISPECIES: hypothetical protein [Sinorhizobium]|uniref:hypothetical protein n=1 Tax=Sinorhizobium TaxID=28105 RepID=UPI0011A7A68C|nr:MULTISPECIES: hypothetical protein [Sinorhizobium]MDW9439257.1 hypothetical protein [Sinorhizobium meliloti]MDW9484080.1 hypothetical protein [Sinorhizobium meliloti]MDX0523533.1 hypothetical protein [Sinorhizobium medicae]MDX0634256.1 hypothetical protein [Sinorhizobium medicae]MQV61396.1 hypothetical protein [Sinorhizobium meliloti]